MGTLVLGVFGIVVIGLLAWAMVWLLPRVHPNGHGVPMVLYALWTPVEILDRKLARGEIDIEQYRRARDALDSGGSSEASPPTDPGGGTHGSNS